MASNTYKNLTPAQPLDKKTLNKMVWRSCNLQGSFNSSMSLRRFLPDSERTTQLTRRSSSEVWRTTRPSLTRLSTICDTPPLVMPSSSAISLILILPSGFLRMQLTTLSWETVALLPGQNSGRLCSRWARRYSVTPNIIRKTSA